MKTWGKYIKPYKLYFILGPLCMIVEVLGEVLMPKLYSLIVKRAETSLSADSGSIWFVIGMAALMIGVAVLMMLGGIGGAYFGARASVNFGSDLRLDVYKKVQKFSFANIDKFQTGSLITRLTNDVTQLQNFVNMLLRMFLRTPGMLIGALIMTITISPKLSTILAISIPMLAIMLATVMRVAFPRFGTMQSKVDELNNTVGENLTNMRVVKSFVREDFEEEKFDDANTNLRDSAMRAMNIMILTQPIMSLVMNLTTLAVVWFGGNMVIFGDLAYSDFNALITYINQILMSLMMVTMLFMSSSRAAASAKRIKEVLLEEPDINDENAANKEKIVSNGEIEFKNVSFRYYKNSPDCVLENISFKIQAGETLGIIGGTGSGKSTLVSLIPRLYDTDSGEVLVDGVNVRDYSLFSLREGIGMVLQKNLLFSGTIKENLRWGNEDATFEEMKDAASVSQAHGFIESFTDGYDHEIERGGTNVSGGQKQRLCIARALLKKPKILILDDSTSAVDTATEANIRHAFATTLKDSTKIIIAQRITSVMEADRILVLDDGKIAGIGTHDELMKVCEEYKEIYALQMENKEVAANG
ncbi:MAG: ABC transporter ATP-binding protein [Ruminococcaceae bacterium]|nr:ABC transporter ATP-binding protein [Oscillospiraceae bacterium]